MTTTKKSKGPNAFITLCAAMIAGTTKDIVANVTVAKAVMTPAQVKAKLGQAPALYGAVTAARAALELAMAAWVAAEPGLRQFVKDYEQTLKGLFGTGNPELKDFGLTLPIKATPSVETKAKALAQRAQTIGVRGPTGKARQAITTQGAPGLLLVSPTGEPIPGALTGPTPPGSGTPATVNLVPATTADAGSSPPASTPSSGSNGTTTGK